MKIYVHYEGVGGPSYTEIMQLDETKGELPVAFLRARLVDGYNAANPGAKPLAPAGLAAVGENGLGATLPADGSVFDFVNDGDDLVFVSADETVCRPPPRPHAPATLRKPIVVTLADTVLGRVRTVRVLVQPGGPAGEPNVIQASRERAGTHSHYYWDNTAERRGAAVASGI